MNALRSSVSILRGLLREPGFLIAFVLTLGLGIGANTAIFSLVNGVLLRPLPYPEADRIVYLEQPVENRGSENINFSFVEVADYREQAKSLDQVVEFGDWTFNVLGRGDPHRAVGGLVTGNFFEVLGMRPQLGRTLEPADRERGAQPVVVLTHEYWQRVFAGDPAVVGQALDLTARTATIVGVLEPGSHYATQRRQDFYANYATNDHYSGASMEEDRTHRMTDVFARLAPGVTVDQARLELEQVAGRLHQEYPDSYPEASGFGIAITPWKEELVRRARPTLLILLATATFVLAIACFNVANLTLARRVRRERELALRSALGAPASRLRGLLFAESLVLSALGASFGLVLAYSLSDALTAYTARFTTRVGEIGVDAQVLFFTVAVAVTVALGFSLAPGIVPEGRLASALASGGGKATLGGRRRLIQRALVVAQLAVSFVLLVGAGLLLRTLSNLHAVDPGFELESVLSLETPKFGPTSREEQAAFSDQVREKVGAFPGVDSVAMAQTAPLGGSRSFPIMLKVEGESEDIRPVPTPVTLEAVSAGYFDTLGMPLLRGRGFDDRDRDGAPRVAVVNQTLVERYFGDRDPLGRTISYSFGGPFSDPQTVIGVVADARMVAVDQASAPALFLPEAQSFSATTVLVRTAGDPTPMTPQVVEAIRALDPERPVEHIRTLAEARAESTAPQRLNATLFGAFAVLALIVAAVGVAAVLAFSVSARQRELGIRAALGADRRRLLRLVLWDAGGLALVGLAIGGAAAAALTRFLAGLLFEVEPLDPATFVTVAVLLLAVALLASLVPARRSTKTDPMRVLRAE